MRFDDRLATVLHQPVQDAHDRAVRWRQLVDLVARAGAYEHSPIVGEALELIASDAEFVPEHLRAAAARAVAAPALPVELVRYFAGEPLTVAVPVLAAVQLSDEQWRGLIADASPEARQFIATLRPGIETAPAPEAEPEEPAEPPAAEPSIADVVKKVERIRQERGRSPTREPRAATPSAAAESAALFRWEADAAGVVDWVEGIPRGAMIGRSIARREGDEGVGEEVERAFAMRSPFRDAVLEVAGEGTAAGRWTISGIPAFSGGRFVGYRGVARRGGPEAGAAAVPMPAADPESLRELVHELKTPLNAILGFAEIIEAQLLGAADPGTRRRAGEIMAEARRLLAAIDDLDLAARLQGERGRSGPGADLGALLDALVDDLADIAAARGAWLDVAPAAEPLPTTVEPTLAERLVRRFCGAVLERVGKGERLHAVADRQGAFCRLAIAEPRALADSSGSELELRLVRGLARVIGGDVSIEQGSVLLALPAA